MLEHAPKALSTVPVCTARGAGPNTGGENRESRASQFPCLRPHRHLGVGRAAHRSISLASTGPLTPAEKCWAGSEQAPLLVGSRPLGQAPCSRGSRAALLQPRAWGWGGREGRLRGAKGTAAL